MNIMEIVSGTGVNGAISHCLLLSDQLLRRGNNVMLVCDPRSWIAAQAAPRGIEIVPSDLHRLPTDELRRVATVVRHREVEVVHTHMSRAHFFGVLLRWFAGVPSVATAHSRHFQPHWMLNDYVIAVSEATRRYHRKLNLVRSQRIETIPTFIESPRAAAIRCDARARARRSLGVDDSACLIGSIGIVLRRKGAIHLVRAMPEVLAAVPNARLALVGEAGPTNYVSEVKSAAEASGVAGQVVWAGHRGDVDEIMAALDLFVLPSLEESFPLAILEAMEAALPVVATAVGGIPECVLPGETGILVPPADSHALAEAIIALLPDPARRRRFGEAGRRRVRENFSIDSQVPRIEDILGRAASRRRKSVSNLFGAAKRQRNGS